MIENKTLPIGKKHLTVLWGRQQERFYILKMIEYKFFLTPEKKKTYIMNSQ
ncbi:MAG: hypothetical protein QNJ08_18555 [Crocosphaera sp.]|nr:hypothetical protein [Crocosphaera sp.]